MHGLENISKLSLYSTLLGSFSPTTYTSVKTLKTKYGQHLINRFNTPYYCAYLSITVIILECVHVNTQACTYIT